MREFFSLLCQKYISIGPFGAPYLWGSSLKLKFASRFINFPLTLLLLHLLVQSMSSSIDSNNSTTVIASAINDTTQSDSITNEIVKQEYKILKCKISSDLDDLDRLHIEYPWIPNSKQVRPSPALLEKKLSDLDKIYNQWHSFKDFIYYHIFDKQYFIRNDKFVVFDIDLTKLPRVFKKNDYPYQVLSNHWILWYNTQIQSVSDERITKDINNELNKLLNSNHSKQYINTFISNPTTTNNDTTNNTNSISKYGNSIEYDFVWYVNPKISVPEFFHVQVFWIII